jgi:single-strand DNA-binding protein
MASVNKIFLIGNVGKVPEVRTTSNGKKVAQFSVATSESYKDKSGNKVSNTEWHNVVVWSPLAEIVEKYVNKGDQIFIEGKVTNRSYDDKDGNKKYITEVVARDITLLGGKKAEDKPGPAASGPADDPNDPPF